MCFWLPKGHFNVFWLPRGPSSACFCSQEVSWTSVLGPKYTVLCVLQTRRALNHVFWLPEVHFGTFCLPRWRFSMCLAPKRKLLLTSWLPRGEIIMCSLCFGSQMGSLTRALGFRDGNSTTIQHPRGDFITCFSSQEGRWACVLAPKRALLLTFFSTFGPSPWRCTPLFLYTAKDYGEKFRVIRHNLQQSFYSAPWATYLISHSLAELPAWLSSCNPPSHFLTLLITLNKSDFTFGNLLKAFCVCWCTEALCYATRSCRGKMNYGVSCDWQVIFRKCRTDTTQHLQFESLRGKYSNTKAGK